MDGGFTMVKERTFLMVKPDGVARRLVGEVISRFEGKGLKLVGAKMMRISRELAKKHYAEHVGKDFYKSLEDFITSGPVLAMVWEGDSAISVARSIMGKTDPKEALPGTIRGDLGIAKTKNIIHGSDSPESAKREIALFFRPEELLDYKLDDEHWLE
jgi:nucleoside-diphosphate kinase